MRRRASRQAALFTDRLRRLTTGRLPVVRRAATSPRVDGAPTVGDAFEVELRASGVTLTVPVERSILSVVEGAGVSTPSFCRRGMCGTCELRVLDGVLDHRDTFLTPAERAAGNRMMICVSRAAPGSRLVIDL